MSAEKSLMLVNSRRRSFLLGGLLVLHLPLLITYFWILWKQTHYQFFPFAIGAFWWLLATRRSSDPERWTWPTKILIAADLVCLVAGFGMNSPWLAAVGLTLGLTAFSMANRDAGYNRRLTYLGLLPLLVVRLPLQYDLQAINWLQRVTTSVASKILHQMGLLHYREGTVLQFPGKTFMVAEACSGVQSLFTILFLAALVICLKRRSIIHGAALLASGAFFAGLMNTTRVITITVAWERYATDWTSGMSHDVLGYACLAMAAMLLLSADAFLGLITDSVPDIAKPGKITWDFLNPITPWWNHLVTVIPISEPGRAITSAVAGNALPLNVTTVNDSRIKPPSSLLRKRKVWFDFVFSWLNCWRQSRTYHQFLAGMPFIVVAVGGAVLAVWLKEASVDPLILRYEKAYNAAVQSSDVVRQETFIRALDSLRPDAPEYRFRLAQFMLRQNRMNEALSEMLRLTPDSTFGYVDARIWLAKQALQPKPLKPMTMDEVETQLKTVLSQLPQHVEAHQILAQVYLERQEWKLAEQHLIEVAHIQPEQNLALARLKKLLKRTPEDIDVTAQLAVKALTKQLDEDRTNPEIRIALAEALTLVGKDGEAREILVSGEVQQDDPALRTALSNFDLFQVDRRLTASPLNRDTSTPVVLQVLTRDPGNVNGVQHLMTLHRMGADVSPDAIQTTLDHWQKTVAEDPDEIESRVILSQLLAVVGDFSGASEALRPTISDRPEFRLFLADWLTKSGQPDEARTLRDAVLQESRSKLEENPKDVQQVARMARAQLALGQIEEAKNLLATFAEDPTKNGIPAEPELASLYGQACLAGFDKLTGYTNDRRKTAEFIFSESSASLAPDVLLQLLQDAVGCNATTNEAIDRIARLSLSSHPAALGAEELVRRLRLEGAQGSQVLNLLGMHAMVMQRFDKATTWLELANAQTRGKEPMILNNLALAILRDTVAEGDKFDRALQLANQTLVILPDHPDVLSTRGEIYVAMKSWQDAVADLTESLKFRKNSAELHRLLETAYTGLPDPQMAEEHRQRAIELEAALVAH